LFRVDFYNNKSLVSLRFVDIYFDCIAYDSMSVLSHGEPESMRS